MVHTTDSGFPLCFSSVLTDFWWKWDTEFHCAGLLLPLTERERTGQNAKQPSFPLPNLSLLNGSSGSENNESYCQKKKKKSALVNCRQHPHCMMSQHCWVQRPKSPLSFIDNTLPRKPGKLGLSGQGRNDGLPTWSSQHHHVRDLKHYLCMLYSGQKEQLPARLW